MNSVGTVTPQRAAFDTRSSCRAASRCREFRACSRLTGELNANAATPFSSVTRLGQPSRGRCHADQPDNVGWWDNLVGQGKPLDTNRFFVVGVNNLGGCYGRPGR